MINVSDLKRTTSGAQVASFHVWRLLFLFVIFVSENNEASHRFEMNGTRSSRQLGSPATASGRKPVTAVGLQSFRSPTGASALDGRPRTSPRSSETNLQVSQAREMAAQARETGRQVAQDAARSAQQTNRFDSVAREAARPAQQTNRLEKLEEFIGALANEQRTSTAEQTARMEGMDQRLS